ncbi:acyltransferase family protein [Falsiroseomonas sp. E2-1-a20]|uniref:acyltransferase family protein n=1 Tax=Falsiroseomonas sp. E2-1-a20 TaxID=3239300 RepID=UPI003F401DB3
MESARNPGTNRISELDALRGLAALGVVLFHYLDWYEGVHEHTTDPLFWLPWGERGVQLFFVISGFVIFMSLQRTRRPMDFVVSRFSRLYPVYWAAILLTTIVVQALGVEYYLRPLSHVFINFSMMQALPFVPGHHIEGAYWTLYVELWFYVAMLILFVLGQLRWIERYMMLGLAMSWIWWGGRVLGGDDAWGWNLTETFGLVLPHLPFFVLGICLYRLHVKEQPRHAALIIVAALLTILVQHPVDFTVTALVALGAIGLILTGRARFLRHPLLVWLGAISYSLYLVHNYAGRALIVRLQEAGWAANESIVVALTAALLAATLLTWLVERPAQRLIRHWYANYRRNDERQIAASAPR